MPTDKNNQQNAMSSDNNLNDSSIVGLYGYVSPYANPSILNQQTTEIPQQIPTQSSNNMQSHLYNEKTPSLEEFLTQPQINQTIGGTTNNILDNSDSVDQILQYGSTLNDTTQPTQQNVPTSSPSQITPDKPTIQSQALTNEDILSSIPTVTSVTQQNQQPNPTFQQTKQKDTNLASQLNPDTDLKQKKSERKYTKISDLFHLVIERNASDLHLNVGYPAHIRIDNKLVPVGDILDKEDVKTLVMQSLTQSHRELLEANREVDLSYQHENKARFRINAYFEKGNLAAAYRLIPSNIRSITDLGLPTILLDITRLSQGLFLVTGPTGSGKSTTLAAMIQHINETSPKHIITIEDPIEYIYPKGTALINQRELGSDTHDWRIAMKSALRQDPDVILIGELRDFETIQLAITLAETGHLVFATLHTNSASQSIDRIIDVFPPNQQQQIKTQLAGSLKGILSQRLVPLIGGGRTAVVELLLVTPAVQNLIREGKTYQIDNVIATSADAGMVSLEKSLAKLVRQGKITIETAQDYAVKPEEVLKLLKSQI